MAAVDASNLPIEWFTPIALSIDYVCGPIDFDADPVPVQLDFTLGETTISLFGRQSDVLPATLDTEAFEIDVDSARINDCCHSNAWYQVLARRVTLTD